MSNPPKLPAFKAGVYDKFKHLYGKQVDATGLGVFRVTFCAVLLAEVLHLFYFRHLVFDAIPFVEEPAIEVFTPLLLWMATLLLLLLGLYTQTTAVVNFGFVLVFFHSLNGYAYMMTPVYINISLLFVVLPISRRLSLDRLRLKLRYSSPHFRYHPPATVSQLAYFVPVVVGIGFVYLDSTFYKLTSPLWLAGLGMWKTLSLPYETQLNSSFVLNNELLVKFLGYFTLAFEFLFLFLFPFRRYRLGLLVIGLGLHLSILLLFTFPLFALGFVSIYLLMVPIRFWQRLLVWGGGASRTLTCYYDAKSPVWARTRVLLAHFDTGQAVRFRSVQAGPEHEPALAGIDQPALLAEVHSVDAHGRVHRGWGAYLRVFGVIPVLMPLAWLLRVPGISHLGRAAYRFAASRRAGRGTAAARGYAAPPLGHGVWWREVKMAAAALGLAGWLLLQGLVSYNTPLVQLLRRKSGLDATLVSRAAAALAGKAAGPAAWFLGITNHPIALDEHFAGYTRLVAITYTGSDGVERFLPLTRPSGQPGPYLYGGLWLKWTYGIISKQLEQERLEKGIRNFTAFWATKHGVDLRRCRFQVKVKKIQEPGRWEPNFLNRQLAAGWQNAGSVTWTNRQFTAHLVSNISSL